MTNVFLAIYWTTVVEVMIGNFPMAIRFATVGLSVPMKDKAVGPSVPITHIQHSCSTVGRAICMHDRYIYRLTRRLQAFNHRYPYNDDLDSVAQAHRDRGGATH